MYDDFPKSRLQENIAANRHAGVAPMQELFNSFCRAVNYLDFTADGFATRWVASTGFNLSATNVLDQSTSPTTR